MMEKVQRLLSHIFDSILYLKNRMDALEVFTENVNTFLKTNIMFVYNSSLNHHDTIQTFLIFLFLCIHLVSCITF